MSRTFVSRIAAWWQNPYGCAIAILLAVYAVVLGLHMKAYASTPDQAGYWNNARLLEKGLARVNQQVIPGLDARKVQPMTFVPLTFRLVGSDQMAPMYPAGFPVALLAVAKVTGWGLAARVTMFVAAMLGILVTAWLGIEMGLPRGWAWFTGLLLAVGPLYTTMSLQLMSDVPALICVTTAVTLAWKSRSRDAWAFLSGIVIACSVFVRPANLVVMLPVGVCLGFAWRRWLFIGLGGLPGAILWCLYNHAAYGHILDTGYGDVGGFFAWSNVPVALLGYARWLPIMLTPVGLFALGLPWLFRNSIRPALVPLVLLIWILAFLGFYSSYSFTNTFLTGAGMRYLLPAFPPCLVGASMVIQRCLQTACGARMAARLGVKGGALLMTVVILCSPICFLGVHPKHTAQAMAVTPTVIHWTDAHIPPNAVVMGMMITGALYAHTPFIVMRSDYLNPDQWGEVVKACSATHHPVYAVITYPFDLAVSGAEPSGENWIMNVGEFLKKQFPGNWKQLATIDDVAIWQLEMPDPVSGKP